MLVVQWHEPKSMARTPWYALIVGRKEKRSVNLEKSWKNVKKKYPQ